MLLQRLLRPGSCGENAKCWLSPWHGEVKGPSHWGGCAHVTFLLFKQRRFAPSPLIFLPPRPTNTTTTTFHFLVLLPSYFIQRSVEKGGVLFHKGAAA